MPKVRGKRIFHNPELSRDQAIDLALWFVSEREKIRQLKETNNPKPWTSDQVLQSKKFCNIFREDDKVSRWIYENADNPYKIAASRFINRIDRLELLKSNDWCMDALIGMSKFNNRAYRITPQVCHRKGYSTINEYVEQQLLSDIPEFVDAMLDYKDLYESADTGNEVFGGCIPFITYQIALDYDYTYSCYNETSQVRVGSGSKPILDVLLGYDTKVGSLVEAQDLLDLFNSRLNLKRELKATDLQHVCCEVRKWHYETTRKQ